jgi:hypothetical protein
MVFAARVAKVVIALAKGLESAADAAVLAGHLWTAHVNVAGGADGQRAAWSTDLGFDAGKESTRRAESGACDRIAEQRGAVVVGTEDSNGGARLRQAIGIDEVDIREQPNRALEHGNRHLGPAVGQRPQGGYVRVGRLTEEFGDLGEHGGNQ